MTILGNGKVSNTFPIAKYAKLNYRAHASASRSNLWYFPTHREHFGMKHHKYSDALLDYGFFLLNVDCICQAVQVYQAALDIRSSVFGGNNLHVAIAHEDLAYSSYVHEYSSGKFGDAKWVPLSSADCRLQLTITCVIMHQNAWMLCHQLWNLMLGNVDRTVWRRNIFWQEFSICQLYIE